MKETSDGNFFFPIKIKRNYGELQQQVAIHQVILFCWSPDPACQELVGKDVDYVYSAYKKSVSQGISAANVVMSLMPMDYAVSVTVSVLGTILDYAYGSSEVTPYDITNTQADAIASAFTDFIWEKVYILWDRYF